ncbi:methyl-accepting chemotaxis protein [Actinoplanes sp. L3-i22]|uniref:methyl-accepting chemotaxis protein n=1 Tax=Actinoplanes sp. L3-i22 TaxID=2836373 RepID=UPI001C74116B|nr:methyl-accepting chemotaxis protein [Actinoplanes sp. L3-i22]BCY14362.1 chemotaxis protein [Actinoplanes sp. L3-i22]
MPLTRTAAGRSTERGRPVRSSGTATRSARPPDPEAARRQARSVARQQRAAERIAAATAEISAQNAQAAEASRRLTELMRQLAAGAEEASGATRPSLAALNRVEEEAARQERTTRRVAELSQALQVRLTEAWVPATVDQAEARRAGSVVTVTELAKQADEIGEIVRTVADLADRTDLLALNAAVEAARARHHGTGFAVVADEVRTLAETGERGARQLRDLVDEVRRGVTGIAAAVRASTGTARDEVANGAAITGQLDGVRAGLGTILTGAAEMSATAQGIRRAAGQAGQRSAEIAAAADQRSAAGERSLLTAGRQTRALRRTEQTAEELAEAAEVLRDSTDIAESAEDVAATAEELAAAVEELNRAAVQIDTAIGEIGVGARTAAEKGRLTAETVGEIERDARLSAERAAAAVARADGVIEGLAANRATADAMIEAIGRAARAGLDNVRKVTGLERTARRIDRIVDAVATVAIRTGLLAVTGSVESARAGEFGRGFATVSTDLRRLAHDSAEHVDRIKDLVGSVRDLIAEVRGDLEETSRQALAEAEAARAGTARLAGIERDMRQVRDGSDEVRGSAEAIAAVLGEARIGLERVAASAEEAGQLAGQAAGAAREQALGAEEMAVAVEEIAALADELRNAA